jgi:hypothetical protein
MKVIESCKDEQMGVYRLIIGYLIWNLKNIKLIKNF